MTSQLKTIDHRALALVVLLALIIGLFTVFNSFGGLSTESGAHNLALAKAKYTSVDTEKPSEVFTGKVKVYQHDDFANPKKSKTRVYLSSPDGDLEIVSSDPLPKLVSGQSVRVLGSRSAKELVPVLIDELPEEISLPDSVGDQRTLVFLLNFQDSPPPPLSRADVETRVFSGPFKQFYAEQSYGRIGFSGSVLDWITLPRNGVVSNNCRWPTLGNGNEIDGLVASNNINLATYDRVVILVNHPCMTSGFSSIGKVPVVVGGQTYNLSVSEVGSLSGYNNPWGSQPFLWTWFDSYLSHEVGHALGLYHAEGWDCGGSTLGTNCQTVSYGNFFDNMGLGTQATHFNGFYKKILGWFTPTDVLVIDHSGIYTLAPLEGGMGQRVAQVKPLNGLENAPSPYYLEYRRGIGFDAKLNSANLVSNQQGLLINQIVAPGGVPSSSRLLDASATGQSWSQDILQASLNGSSVFTDSNRGVSVGPIISANATGITFSVNLTPTTCERHDPEIVPTSSFDTLAPGSASILYVRLTNQDSASCGASNFSVAPELPGNNWLTSLTPPNEFLDSGETGFFFLNFSVPLDTAPGQYSIRLVFTNITSGEVFSYEHLLEVISPPVVSSLIPVSGWPGSNLTISGSGFGENPSVYIEGQNNIAVINQSSTNNGTAIYAQFPTRVYNDDCACEIIPPNGQYAVSVSVNGVISNSQTFTVINQGKFLPIVEFEGLDSSEAWP